MANSVPSETIRAFARTICSEAEKYGFRQLDMVRLINEMMDLSTEERFSNERAAKLSPIEPKTSQIRSFPLRSERLTIRLADPVDDLTILQHWLSDRYGQHFVLSCATAQPTAIDALLSNPVNQVGIVSSDQYGDIGAVAFLDIDRSQRRAELRKLIGEPSARGQGFAEEATRIWIDYGASKLKLEKVYLSTLQTHLRNIQLNESIGFRVEGVLRQDILIDGERHDVLRMGLCMSTLDSEN